MTQTASKTSGIFTEAATKYAAAKASDVITNFGERAAGTAPKKEKDPDDKGFMGTAAEKLGEGAGPVKAAMSGIGGGIKNLFSGKGKTRRPTNIVEDVYVGVPPDQAFAAWVDYEEWAKFSKGITQVNRKKGESEDDQEETDWTAKVFLSRRSWHATTTDFDPPNRIAWQSEGAKGTIEGTVTFTPVGENATMILVVLEYRPKGPIEWIGNRWRAAGRRARLDLKHFRRYVMRTEPEELPEPEDQQDQEEQDRPQEGEQDDLSPSEDSDDSQDHEEPEEAQNGSEDDREPEMAGSGRPARRKRS